MHPRAGEVRIDLTLLSVIDLDGLCRARRTVRTLLRPSKLPTNTFHAFYTLSNCAFSTGSHRAAGHLTVTP